MPPVLTCRHLLGAGGGPPPHQQVPRSDTPSKKAKPASAVGTNAPSEPRRAHSLYSFAPSASESSEAAGEAAGFYTKGKGEMSKGFKLLFLLSSCPLWGRPGGSVGDASRSWWRGCEIRRRAPCSAGSLPGFSLSLSLCPSCPCSLSLSQIDKSLRREELSGCSTADGRAGKQDSKKQRPPVLQETVAQSDMSEDMRRKSHTRQALAAPWGFWLEPSAQGSPSPTQESRCVGRTGGGWEERSTAWTHHI